MDSNIVLAEFDVIWNGGCKQCSGHLSWPEAVERQIALGRMHSECLI